MKKISLMSALLMAALVACSQNDFIGTWEGKLNAGIDIRKEVVENCYIHSG
jgi:hypothetical protein